MATSAEAAAFANGALGNVLEMDDVDKRATLHPGPSVIPAALALAEETGASGAALLDAIVVGYEATIRVGRAVGPGHYRFWHNTGTCGPYGAAAACARLLGLDEAATADALGLAGTAAGGLWQTRHEPNSAAKQLHTAKAAQAGLQAARLAQSGLGGPRAIFEGPQGVFAAMCPGANPEDILPVPGPPWAVHETSFKPWPACRHAHAAIDAALAVRASLTLDAVESVQVLTYPDAITFCDRPVPETVLQAKFSLQHAVSVVLLRGEPRLADFEPEAFDAEVVRALAKKVSVGEGEPFTSAYPARYGAKLDIVLKDGRLISETAADAWGDPENPMSEADIIAKAAMLGTEGAGLEPKPVNDAIHAALALPYASDLTGLKAAFDALR